MTSPLIVSDSEAAVQAYLQAQIPTWRSVTELPNDLLAALPVYRTTTIGGPIKGNLMAAHVSIEAFAATRQAARAGAILAVNTLKQAVGTIVNAVAISRVDVNSGPQILTYENMNLRRCYVLLDVYCRPRP